MPNKEKSNDSKKRKKKSKKSSRKVWKIILITLLIMFLVGMGLLVGAIVAILNGAGALSRADFEISDFTTVIYDKNGKEYATLYNEENRYYSSLDEMSPYLPKAFIAIEDERFEKHFGIDIKRTGAAIVKFVTTGNSDFGGSTITQQLVKKVTKDDDRSWQRKAREIVRAVQVEQWLTKDQIIELYMNIIYLGSGAYGVETAASTYFDKTAEELTIAEAALIAGLAQAPEGYNPYNHPEKAKNRQKLVLGKMLECGYIDQSQYDEAINQELVYIRGTLESSSSNDYFVDALVDQLAEDLQEEKGVTKIMAQKMIYSNGLKIYSTIDPEIQSTMETVYQDESYFKLRNGEYDPELQSAMVVIDYSKGNVVGLVGGAGEKTVLRGLNRATQTYRAPGSTIKPLAVYAPGIDSKAFTAATTFDDVPTTFKVGVHTWAPNNSYKTHRGLTTVRKAIEVSSNIIAAKAYETVGANTSIAYLKKFGITSIDDSRDVYPGALALGGLTKGMSTYEHAAAYSAIANCGIYLEPKLYTKVVDREQQILIEKTSTLREVISQDSAYLMTSMLRNVVNGSEGTGGSAALPNGMLVAGKTGTTNDSMDRWFAGYTPYYAASVWVGYDQQKTVNASGNPAAKIWKAVMKEVHADLSASNYPKTTSFTKPKTVVSMEVCADSGLLATELCKNDPRGDRTVTEYFSKSNLPKEECTTHVKIQVCADTLLLPNPTCLNMHTLVEKICLDRKYEQKPSALPKDIDYEIPFDYCEFHYCPKDEFGNYIVEEAEDYPAGWEGNFNPEGSGNGSGNQEDKKQEDFWWLD